MDVPVVHPSFQIKMQILFLTVSPVYLLVLSIQQVLLFLPLLPLLLSMPTVPTLLQTIVISHLAYELISLLLHYFFQSTPHFVDKKWRVEV
jgi:hypothetical protein